MNLITSGAAFLFTPFIESVYIIFFNSGSVDLTSTSSFCTLSHDSLQTEIK